MLTLDNIKPLYAHKIKMSPQQIVMLGDVGFINNGYFHRLFNVLDPQNNGVCPNTFPPFGSVESTQTEAFSGRIYDTGTALREG